ncbi:unnamed protein product, partial [Ectocarpus fasciculatus]
VHDPRKGWSCYKKRVYDWDESEQLQGDLGVGMKVARWGATAPLIPRTASRRIHPQQHRRW